MARTKVTIQNVDAKKLESFLKRTHIGKDSPQTYKLSSEGIESRAYPRSKSFIVANKTAWDSLTDAKIPEMDLKLPMVDLDKLISSLGLFSGKKISLVMDVEGGNVGKIDVVDGKNKFSLKSGSLGTTPPFLPDDIFDKMFCLDDAKASFQLDKKSLGTINSMHTISRENSEETTIQVRKDGTDVVFSSQQEMEEQVGSDWNFSLEALKNDMDDSTYVVNSSFISKMKDYDNVVHFKDWNTLNLFIFVNDYCRMACVLLKAV